MSVVVAEKADRAQPPSRKTGWSGRRAARPRPPLWREALVIGSLLWLYDAVNNLSSLRLSTALANATGILHVERILHIDAETPLNTWMAVHRGLGLIISNYYDNAHFIVTFALVGWLWWRHPGHYRPLRNMLVLTNVIGFVVFWLYPVAPPRMLPGFVDVVATTHAWGAWHSGALASQANELAAMPSLHMAWALWCGLALWLIARRWPLKVAAVVYPAVTCVAVLTTANHFLIDVVAGAGAAVLAAGLAYGWVWWRNQRTAGPDERQRAPGPSAPAPSDAAAADAA